MLPILRDLAQGKAAAATKGFGFSQAERLDLESQLVLKVLTKFNKFDSKRASFATFASRLMDNELRSIRRSRMAVRRRHVEVSYEEERELNKTKRLTLGRLRPTVLVREEFWLDVGTAIGNQEGLLEVAIALAFNRPSDAAELLRISRSRLYRRIKQLRHFLEAAGIVPGYFGD